MRKSLTVTVEKSTHTNLNKLSELTRIPASRLFDEAAKDLLIKHNFYERCAKAKANTKTNYQKSSPK